MSTFDWSNASERWLRDEAARLHHRADYELEITDTKRELLRYAANELSTELAKRFITRRAEGMT